MSLLAIVALAGCGSTGVDDGGPGFPAAMAETDGIWQVIDLANGTVTAHASLPDLAIDPAYRDRLLAFRLVPRGTAPIGQAAGSPAYQADELLDSVTHGGFFIAAFELTRAQWLRLAGDSPWQDLLPAGIAGDADDTLPATGMSAARALSVLAQASGRLGRRLGLPQPWEWEVAARAGGGGIMPWGDDLSPTTAGTWAWTATSAPHPVGSLAGNAFGLFDCIGNVWEFTADGAMRGGSWVDPLALARPANCDVLLAGDGAPHVGLRLVYRP